MADVSINEMKAKVWIQEVQNELALVNNVMRGVDETLSRIPTEGDTITENLEKIGKAMEDICQRLNNGFTEIGKKISTAISNAHKVGTKVVDEIGTARAKIGN